MTKQEILWLATRVWCSIALGSWCLTLVSAPSTISVILGGIGLSMIAYYWLPDFTDIDSIRRKLNLED